MAPFIIVPAGGNIFDSVLWITTLSLLNTLTISILNSSEEIFPMSQGCPPPPG